ncbi:IS66 family transposase [Mucilaginibacter rubeus]|uniref:IS66 family transposase n=1 Tax=Mucilaginibacter rubeus TaxID=2027860 RepID=A0AAE6MIW0_9SPHI|nr:MULTISPECIES: IS66 family transposase [Mucilaginibacter]QEM05028.1 IS66 family transposase [Mucilaginibacter rubeus]QEM17623.1 IS66 family transposase [Mucilaginibacter gossypii]QTE45857.1 IS66 family transposase [Mucilaginibacter rubeus]QTE52454.1 IS66 family transposase [Mucilaginibacter rubeus]QTE57542.1 IS66 family transposase [Mucilaginibacter rubeus]
METALENLSKEDLLKVISSRDEKIDSLTSLNSSLVQERDYLKSQVEMFKRMQFGQKRERFEGDPNQTLLPFEADAIAVAQQQESIKEKIEYIRKRPNHHGRAKLPEHLPVEEIEIHPEGDLSAMVCIGKEVTEELECEPARFFIKRYIRYKYAAKNGEGVKIAELPERVIDKGIPGAGLLASILVDKYVDHLPLYRQKQRFARENIQLASLTIEGWTKEALFKLEPLYQQLVFDTKSKGYLQVDETPIKVLDSDKKGAAHQGYYWVYHAPLEGTVLFDYSPTRGQLAPLPILGNFKGYLQTDGYVVYEKYARSKDITHLACWAHARREFEKALDNDRSKAEKALLLIQKLYAVERIAREGQLDTAQIKELRLKESLPIINEMGKWIFQEIKSTLPKSQVGKAMAYAYARWDALSAYLYDGSLRIDNNPVENAIRPIALGRKNYLFAGSHEAAQRAAMIYSFCAICKKHEVNTFQWLRYTLENIMSINHKNIKELYPQNFKNISR